MDEKTKASMMKYRKASREQIQIDVAKGVKAKVKAYAEKRGMSMSALIMTLLENEMTHDGFSAEWEKRVAMEKAKQETIKKAEIERIKAENAAAMLETLKKK